MNKLYYVDVKLFDSFEETSSLIRRAVIAKDEDKARGIVAEQLDKEIEEVANPCSGYEIVKIIFIREVWLIWKFTMWNL